MKNKIIIISIILNFIFSFSVLAEEKKIDEIKLEKVKTNILLPQKEYSLYFFPSPAFNYNKIEFGISKKLNDFFEIKGSLSKYSSGNIRPFTELKLYPFKQENLIFCGTGIGFEQITKIKENTTIVRLNTTYETVALYYYVNLGFDFPLTKDIKLEINTAYFNILNGKENDFYNPLITNFYIIIDI
ncbi:MAG: hypothetical protein AABZ74_14060 [Cyanobacteriota bacterium]